MRAAHVLFAVLTIALCCPGGTKQVQQACVGEQTGMGELGWDLNDRLLSLERETSSDEPQQDDGNTVAINVNLI